MEYLVLDIGGTFIKYAYVDEKGIVQRQGQLKTPTDKIEHFYQMLDMLIESHIQGIALSFPGPVDIERGVILQGGSLDYMTGLALADGLTRRYGVSVSIENDARCAALAEIWRGNLQHVKVGMVLVFGTGIGACITMDKTLFKGAHNFSGEIACMLNHNSEMLHKEAGIPFLLENISSALHLSETIDGKQMFQLLKEKDPIVTTIFHEYCDVIARQIFNIQCLIDTQRICIGGGVSQQQLFISSLKTAFDTLYHNTQARIPIPEIISCKFHNQANIIGAFYHHRTCTLI